MLLLLNCFEHHPPLMNDDVCERAVLLAQSLAPDARKIIVRAIYEQIIPQLITQLGGWEQLLLEAKEARVDQPA